MNDIKRKPRKPNRHEKITYIYEYAKFSYLRDMHRNAERISHASKHLREMENECADYGFASVDELKNLVLPIVEKLRRSDFVSQDCRGCNIVEIVKRIP